jgi:TatD DNase family protein
LIDTHCHVHDKKFDGDRDAVIARARRAGVTAMITVGEDLDDSRLAAEVAGQYGLHVAAGIHPHESRNAPRGLAAELLPILNDETVIAIGETGLDYYYDFSPRDVQAEVLRAQLDVALETGMPVVFHQRDAFEDFTAILRRRWTRGMRGVVHCFTGTPEQARTYVDEFGLMLGIGGVLTFPNAQSLRDAVVQVGLDWIVLETDCPYLAPVPMRGKRNEPAFVAHTATRVAQLLGVSLADVTARTDANAVRLFGLTAVPDLVD